MRAIFSITMYILLFTLGSCNLRDEISPSGSGCSVSEKIEKDFNKDAVILTYRNTFTNPKSAYYQRAEIDKKIRDKILKAIQAVYLSQSPERDTVFNIYSIHVFPRNDLRTITLEVDSSSPAIKNLIKNQAYTENNKFDSLINRYGLKFKGTSSLYPRIPFIYLISDNPLNTSYLAREFKKTDPVITAEPGIFSGDGNNISFSDKNGNVILDFSVGYEQCPSGCRKRRGWVFHVSPTCEVTFVRSYGNPPPRKNLASRQ